ncbi:MAG: HlyD family efflux transporter periplasmic adaptor subunit [Methanosarcina sp.]|nr:HlyD family efflux transporter periplasmic adaptor subunit [Methanosarcina sp.]
MALENQELLVQNLQNFLAQFRVTAPADGMIIYKKDRLGTKRKAGSSINPFDNVIATLPDLTTMLSKVYVSEIEVTKVVPGMKVNITVDAIPGKSYTGSVISVANIGEVLPNSDAKMFEVMIRIDGTDMNLRPSMTAWNKIILKSIPDVVYIPLECVHAESDSLQYVYKKNKTRQVVILGEVNDKNVIVKEGLEEGTQLFVVVPEDGESFRLVGKDLLSKL